LRRHESGGLRSADAERVNRLSLVETEGARMDGDVYTELVAAERTVGALLRRLNRVASRVK